ncbi:hypothetical protein [Falsiroseomonas sp. E2-1-a20]|uniref:hypothetical protein n=1 Tax=Falsiroseomonas sp. E2-1-a20 TaxID=3239300 RepID=UPI003F38CB94
MHIIMRRFPGAAHLAEEGARKTREFLIPILQKHPGWKGFVGFESEQGDVWACTMYSDASAARELAERAAAWRQENMSEFPPPENFLGEVGAHMTLKSGGQDDLYCMVRKAEGAPASSPEPIGEKILNAAKSLPGLKGAYIMRSTDDPTKAASLWLCDSREHAMTVHEETMGVHIPGVKTRLVGAGKAVILALP